MEPKWSVVFPSIHRVEGRKLAGSTFSARSSISDSTQGYVERIYTFSDRVASAPTIAAAAVGRRGGGRRNHAASESFSVKGKVRQTSKHNIFV